MPINSDLSLLSDYAIQGTFLAYLVALVLSLTSYVKLQGVIKNRRALKDREEVNDRELAAVGAGGSGDGAGEDPARPVEDLPTEGELDRREDSAHTWGKAAQSVVWLGIILHAAGIVARGFAVQRFPLGNLYEYMLAITGVAMLVAALVIQRKSLRFAWPWVLTAILVLLFYGSTKLYAESAPVVPALQSHWLPFHVTTVSVGGSLGLISGLFSALYLLRVWQPAGKERGVAGAIARPLPTARRLDEIAYRLAVFTLPILGVGILLGAIWADTAWGRPWGWDPKETLSFITWILYAAYLHARATAGWRVGAAWINILALAAMIFNLFFVNLVVSGLHSYAGLN
ncbi:c-type cytochrome biogenesis protein CcsB [Corynebacterium otitidis]|uniref:c-type cytochrome biogenesis protein CcsB n=1 Tax=Corynebacterium otitidis TaxID=29321 RepID=UPI00062783E4|nr:c-type cytochrome biogenesis protein CcsB [Corynebacterium otitidis]KKO83041.1 cytochrome C biogenesis protein [Corynebacterium otitidis]